ncbi:MAG: hypothetical protein ABFC34_07770 [Methanobacterium sp.]
MLPKPYFKQITPEWNDLPLVPTDHAIDKMMELGMRLYDVEILLEYGKSCEKGR